MYTYFYLLGIKLKGLKHNILIKCGTMYTAPILIIGLLSSYNALFLFIPIFIYMLLLFSPFILKAPFILSIGKNSSSIFVWHAPIVLPLISLILFELLGGGYIIVVPLIGLTILVSILISTLTFKFKFFKFWRF